MISLLFNVAIGCLRHRDAVALCDRQRLTPPTSSRKEPLIGGGAGLMHLSPSLLCGRDHHP